MGLELWVDDELEGIGWVYGWVYGLVFGLVYEFVCGCLCVYL